MTLPLQAIVGLGSPYTKRGHPLGGGASLSPSLSGRRDLNPGPQHPDCCALAWLRYAPHAEYYTPLSPLDKSADDLGCTKELPWAVWKNPQTTPERAPQGRSESCPVTRCSTNALVGSSVEADRMESRGLIAGRSRGSGSGSGRGRSNEFDACHGKTVQTDSALRTWGSSAFQRTSRCQPTVSTVGAACSTLRWHPLAGARES